MGKQDDSDPLPYIKVDRSLAPKAAALAGLIGTTNQHAKGSLIDFWELHSDPRTLEALVTRGETAVLLSREAVVRTFRIASGGKDVDPDDLVVLGLLEKNGESFRVRGMSRALAPIIERLHTRALTSEAGRASAAAREAKYGTAIPIGARNSPNGHPTPPNPNGQRSAVSGHRSEISKEAVARTRTLSKQEVSFTIMETRRADHCREVGVDPGPPVATDPRKVNTLINRALEASGLATPDELEALYDDHFLLGTFGSEVGWPVGLFLSPGVIKRTIADRMRDQTKKRLSDAREYAIATGRPFAESGEP